MGLGGDKGTGEWSGTPVSLWQSRSKKDHLRAASQVQHGEQSLTKSLKSDRTGPLLAGVSAGQEAGT